MIKDHHKHSWVKIWQYPKDAVNLQRTINMVNMCTPKMERPKALQEAVFTRLFQQAEIAQFSENELRDYRESQKDYWDLYSITKTAEDKGVAKGRAEGRAEERELQLRNQEQERIASIKSFREMGIPDEKIAAGLHLPLEYIQQH